MSGTYIGPFGRLLPGSEGSDPLPNRLPPPPPPPSSLLLLSHSHPYVQQRVDGEPARTMNEPPPPRLPLPSGLIFGTDPRPGFSDPSRYESFTRGTPGPVRSSASQEKLPSVNLLLSSDRPPSTSSPTASAFSRPPYQAPNEAGRHQSSILSGDAVHHRYEDLHGRRNSSISSMRNAPAPRDPERPLLGLYPYIPPEGQSEDLAAFPPADSLGGDPASLSQGHADSRSPPESADALRSKLVTVPKPVVKLLGEQIFPGEGVCYVYDDGTHVKKVIDGEAVNASWGITKAGKPRKRLAIACITCREKKIKCDPAEPKCVQCEKSGRVCRFQTAARSHIQKPSPPSYEQQAPTPSSIGDRLEQVSPGPGTPMSPYGLLVGDRVLDGRPQALTSSDGTSISGEINQISDATKAIALKKRRRTDPARTVRLSPTDAEPGPVTESGPLVMSPKPKASEELGSLDWHTDPYQVAPELILHYTEAFFFRTTASLYSVLPRKPFLHWMETSTTKTMDELMLFYALLAKGADQSSRPESPADAKIFYGIAATALKERQKDLTVCIMLTRLMVAMHCLFVNDIPTGAAFLIAAIAGVITLKMHKESSYPAALKRETPLFGLNVAAWTECRRRTFWAAFIMDRYGGFTINRLANVQKEDVALRLPCENSLYEQQADVCTPFFDNDIIDKRLCRLTPSMTHQGLQAYLLQIMCIGGDMLREAERTRNQAEEDYPPFFEAFYTKMNEKLLAWHASLPDYLHFDRSRALTAMREGYDGVYQTMYAIYHLSTMILNRSVRYALLDEQSVVRNVQRAIDAAVKLLACAKADIDCSEHATAHVVHVTPPPSPHDAIANPGASFTCPFSFANPFVALAAAYAIDILSSAGPLQQYSVDRVVAAFETTKVILDHSPFSHFYIRRLEMDTRFRDLLDFFAKCRGGSGGDGGGNGGGDGGGDGVGGEAGGWMFENSLAALEAEDVDIFYQHGSRQAFLEAMEIGTGDRIHVLG